MMQKNIHMRTLSLLLLVCIPLLAASCGPKMSFTAGSDNSNVGQTGAWFSLHLFPDHSGWAFTYRSLLHTDDGGLHWQNVSPWPADTKPGSYIGPLSTFLSGKVAWVVLPGDTVYVKYGNDNTPKLARAFRTVDGGKTWQSGTIPGTGSTYRNALSGAGFIAGTFRQFNPLSDNYDIVSVKSISAIDGQNAWITVGETVEHAGGGQESITPISLRILHSSDGGQHWQMQINDKPDHSGKLRFDGHWITFINNTTGFTKGLTLNSLMVSHDGGQSWQEQSLPMPDLTADEIEESWQDGLHFFDAQNGLIPVHFYQNGSIKLFQYLTHDGGQHWQMNAIQSFPSGLYSMYLDAQHWILVADNKTFFKTNDGGLHWLPGTIQTNLQFVVDATSLSANEFWVIVREKQEMDSNQLSQDNATSLLKTTDGGKTWTQVNYTVSN